MTGDGAGETAPPAQASTGDGRYRIEGEFARGGLGRVLAARDERLGRPVAVKELLSSDPQQRLRFEREAAITARLEHPAIVPVHDTGRWDNGAPYYVMKLLSAGRTLKEVVDQAPDFDARLALLPNVIAVADAIAYAHSLGIIHRDLKPSNILIGPFGETMVIDWGLAKDLSQSSGDEELKAGPYRAAAPELTAVGNIIGTPQFMAPEQARGESVDKRADVYALGAVLFHVLGGVAPFSGGTPELIIHKVVNGTPKPLRELQPGIPVDLLAIVEKAMAPERADRYASAAELTEDLKRFQTGKLVGAYRYSSSRLLGRWIWRHRIPVAVAAFGAGLLLALGIVSFRRVQGERAVAVATRNALILEQARSALERDPTMALGWLKTYPVDGRDPAGAQVIAGNAQSEGVARHLLPGGPVQTFAVSPDDKYVFTSGLMQPVRQWDLATGRLVQAVSFGRSTKQVRVSPDGKQVAVADFDGDIFLWSLSGGEHHLVGNQNGRAWDVVFSPDGRSLVSAGEGSVTLWNLQSGRSRQLSGPWGTVTATAFSPDGALLATAALDGVLRIWDLARGESGALVSGQKAAINDAHFSPDGKFIVASGADGSIRLWDVGGGTERILGRHSGEALAVRFSPDGKLVASTGRDHEVRIWSLDGRPARTLSGHTDEVLELAFAPDSRRLASCGRDAQIRIWDLLDGESRELQGHRGPVLNVAFTADGRSLISGGVDEAARVWNVPPSRMQIIDRHQTAVSRFAVSRDGTELASAADNGDIHVRLSADGPWRSLTGHDQRVEALEFSPDGQSLASAGWDGITREWNLRNGTSKILSADQQRVLSLDYSADGRLLAAGGTSGAVSVWNAMSGQLRVQLLGHKGEVWATSFSPEGRLLATAGGDGTVRLWDIASGNARVLGKHDQAATVLAFAPDGKTLASGGEDGTVRLWDVSTGTMEILRGHADKISRLSFLPDGRRLISTSWDNTVRIWTRATGQARVLRGPRLHVRGLAVAPDGRSIVAASDDGHLYFWDLDQLGYRVVDGMSPIHGLAFAPDGSSLFTAGDDGTIRQWRLSTGPPAPRQMSELQSWLHDQTTAELSKPPTSNVENNTGEEHER